MTHRRWICPDCGSSWTTNTSAHIDPRCAQTRDVCPGVPIEHVAAPIADARDGWQVDNGYGLVVIDREPFQTNQRVVVIPPVSA